MSTRTIRVLIADDHQMFRESLRRMLEGGQGFAVVGEASNGLELLKLAETMPCDVLLLDVAMPAMDGVEVLRLLGERQLRLRTIVLTAGAGQQTLLEALRHGARGILLKDVSVDVLYKAIREVAAGRYALDASHLQTIAQGLSATSEVRPADTLTRRERQIMTAVANGASNKQVAAQFGLSERTVKNHLSNIFNKVGVSNRIELALYVVSRGLTGEDLPAG